MTHPTWTLTDEALANLFISPNPALDAAIASSKAAGLPDIAVSPLLGKFLAMLVKISGANRILEIGTLCGYSTIWLASALPQEGSLTSLELRENYAEVAHQNIARANLEARVDILVGPAAETLKTLANRPRLDTVALQTVGIKGHDGIVIARTVG